MKKSYLSHVFKSIHLNIIVLYSSLILICILVLSTLSYKIFYSIAQEQAVENIGLLTEQIADSLNVYFEEITGAINLFRSDLTLKQDILNCNKIKQKERYEYIKNIEEKMRQIILYDNDIQDIVIISENFKMNCLDTGNNIINYKSKVIKDILEDSARMRKYDIEFLSVKNEEYNYGGYEKEEMLIYFPIKDMVGEETIATMIYIFSFDRINEMTQKEEIWKRYKVYLIDEQGELFYEPAIDSNMELPLVDWSNNEDISILEEDKILSYAKIEAINWRIGYQIDLSEIRESLKPIGKFSIGISIVAILVAIYLSIYIGYRCTMPIRKLSESMKKIGNGNFHIQVSAENSYEEINNLNKSFNTMVQEIDRLIKEVYTIKLAKQQAEIEALQSKINPHFLNNTLQTITSLAVLERTEEIIVVMESLSHLFNYMLYETSDMLPIEKEIEHIKHYIDIQNVRFNHSIILKIAIEKEVMAYKIPKLLIQPIIENAIQHGFKDCMGIKRIFLKGQIKEGRVILKVIDNGKGINAEKLQNLRCVLREESMPGEHIGLINVNKRLKLTYGQGSGIAIKSVEPYYSKFKLIMGQLEEK